MASYLTLAEFKARTLMPASSVDAIELVSAGWLLIQLDEASAWIDSRLRKRYAAPFESPYPIAVLSWVARLVTVRAFLKAGVPPTDEQFQAIQKDADDARAEVLEAATSDVGLFDLPLRSDTTATGISKSGPMSYSEQSPYAWARDQRRIGRNEDSNGGGTYHG